MPGDGQIMTLEKQASSLSPFALAGSANINSMYSPNFVPSVGLKN